MAAPSILGTKVLVGFPSADAVTGIVRDTHDVETTADIEHIRDEDNNEVTALVSNPGRRITVEGVCTEDPGISVGDVVTIDGVVYLVESAVIRHQKTATRFSLTGYKPTAASCRAPCGRVD